MIIKRQPVEEKMFEPFSITFTIENEKEAEVFFALFNHTTIADWLNHYIPGTAEKVRLLIGTVAYNQYFNELKRRIDERR